MKLVFTPALDAMQQMETLQKQLAADPHNAELTEKIGTTAVEIAGNLVEIVPDAGGLHRQILNLSQIGNDIIVERCV